MTRLRRRTLSTRDVAFLVWPLMGCAALQLGPAGSPSGGPYCFQGPGKPEACYQSESERATAQSRRQSDIEDEAKRKREAELAAHAGEESPQQRAWREQEEANVAEHAERDRVFADRHVAEDARRAADASRTAELHAMAQDPAYAVPAISAIMCSIQEEIVGLKADLAHEKRVTAVGGVVNLSARDEAANDLVNDTDELSTWKAALKRYGATQLPCKDVAPIVACRNRIESCPDDARGPARFGRGSRRLSGARIKSGRAARRFSIGANDSHGRLGDEDGSLSARSVLNADQLLLVVASLVHCGDLAVLRDQPNQVWAADLIATRGDSAVAFVRKAPTVGFFL